MKTLSVAAGIQFRQDLFGAKFADRGEWFKAIGTELANRKLSVMVAPDVVIGNADEATALFTRFQTDPGGLTLPAGVTLEQYLGDLVEALDDAAKPTSDLGDMMVDFSPVSPFAKLLGLDVPAAYADATTSFAKGGPDKVFRIGDWMLSAHEAGWDPLAGQLFIDKATFGTQGYDWKRTGVELEQVTGVAGPSGQKLLAALRAKNAAGRTGFERLRKPEAVEALTIGYSGVSLDEMRWDDAAHTFREALKKVCLNIEDERYEIDPKSGMREISLGTDKMDDTYYDTKDFTLAKSNFFIRGRARWDTDTSMRRILVQAKADTEMDKFGLKRTNKVDVRNDSATADQIKSMDNDIRTGSASWSKPLSPIQGIYAKLAASRNLKDIGPHQGVLQLEPQLHMRSVRSRYHLNEASIESMKAFYTEVSVKLDAVLAQAQAVKPQLQGQDLEKVTALETAAKGLKDGSAILASVEGKLTGVPAPMTADALLPLLPTVQVNWNSPADDAKTLENKRVVSEALDAAYHQFSAQLDDVRRVLTGSQDRSLENFPVMVMAWCKSVDKTLVPKRTYDAFLGRYDQVAAKADPERAADLQAFNDFGAAQLAAKNKDFKDFVPLDDAKFKALRPQLVNEVMRVTERQLEAAGTMARQIWFDSARKFYVPDSTRNTSNFIIDTMDMSEYYTDESWNSIPEDKRTPANEIPADKVMHATLVNETQIELGLEKPYLDRLDELGKMIQSDQASMVMKYFDSVAFKGVEQDDAASYSTALNSLLTLTPGRLNAELKKLNAFLTAQKSVLKPFTVEDLQGLGKNYQLKRDHLSLVTRFLESIQPQNTPAAYAEALHTTLGFGDAAVAEWVGKLNAFLEARGEPLLNESDLRELDDRKFTLAARDLPVRTDNSTETMLAGALMIFQAYIDVQKTVVATKEARVRKVLEDAGLKNLRWEHFEKAKGEIGLDMIRAGGH